MNPIVVVSGFYVTVITAAWYLNAVRELAKSRVNHTVRFDDRLRK